METMLLKTRVLQVIGCDGCGKRLTEMAFGMSVKQVEEHMAEDPENFYASVDTKHNTAYTQWVGQSHCRYC